MTDGYTQPVVSSGCWQAGLRIKNATDIKKRVMVLWGEEGGSEKSIAQSHTAGITANMLFKWQQRAGLSPPRGGGRGGKLQHASINGNENRCQSNLRLNGVRLEIENILLLSHAGYNYESEQSAANHTSLLLRGRVNVSAGTSDGAVSFFNLSIQIW